MTNTLICDIGDSIMKMIVISYFPKEQCNFILHIEMVDIEQQSLNTIAREFAKSYNRISSNITIDKVVLIPMSDISLTRSKVVPRVEYFDNASDMRKAIIKAIAENQDDSIGFNSSDYLNDWKVQEDNPNKNYQSIIASTIPYNYFLSLKGLIEGNKIKDFIITSCAVGYPYIVPFNDMSYLVLDIGNHLLKMSICENGILQMYNETSISFFQVISSLREKLNKKEVYELLSRGNVSEIIDNDDALSYFSEIRKSVARIVNDYAKIFNRRVLYYTAIGGISNFNIEKIFTDSFNDDCDDILSIMTRIYPKSSFNYDTPLARFSNIKTARSKQQIEEFKQCLNDNKYYYLNIDLSNATAVPDCVYNYILPALSVYQSLMVENSDTLDFQSSKYRSITNTVKACQQFSKFAIPISIYIMILTVGLLISIFVSCQLLESKHDELKLQLNSQTNEIKGLEEELKRKTQELNDMRVSTTDEKVYDLGALLEHIGQQSVVDTYIRSVKSEDGINFVLTGYTDAKFKASDLAIRLKNVFEYSTLSKLDTQVDINNTMIFEFETVCSGIKQ